MEDSSGDEGLEMMPKRKGNKVIDEASEEERDRDEVEDAPPPPPPNRAGTEPLISQEWMESGDAAFEAPCLEHFVKDNCWGGTLIRSPGWIWEAPSLLASSTSSTRSYSSRPSTPASEPTSKKTPGTALL